MSDRYVVAVAGNVVVCDDCAIDIEAGEEYGVVNAREVAPFECETFEARRVVFTERGGKLQPVTTRKAGKDVVVEEVVSVGRGKFSLDTWLVAERTGESGILMSHCPRCNAPPGTRHTLKVLRVSDEPLHPETAHEARRIALPWKE